MMTDQQEKRLLQKVESAVVQTVNGKIRNLDVKVTDYIQADTRWKEENQAALDNMRNITTTWKILLSLFGSLAVVAAAIVAFKKLLFG